MPRLPTIRVMGSQFMSTSVRFPFWPAKEVSVVTAICSVLSHSIPVSRGHITCGESRSFVAPFGLSITAVICDGTQRTDHRAVYAYRARRQFRAWRFVHKRHELVWESWHRAADANAADIRAAANASHPTPLRYVAVDHWPPAADFDQALRRTVFMREIALLVITSAIASFMHCLPE